MSDNRQLMGIGFCICALLMPVLAACGARNPEENPLYAMHVTDMFPGDRQAQALALAAADGDIGRMDRLVAKGADVNAVGSHGVTVPTWVLYHPNKRGFKHLLELGADPNIYWKDGTTLLHWITRMTDRVGIEYLQMALDIGGGDPNVQRPYNGKRPIQNTFMLTKNKLDAFALLYNAGAEIDYKDKLDVPLVDHAASSENFDLVYFLLGKGVDYTTSNPIGGIAVTLEVSVERRNQGKRGTSQYMWFLALRGFSRKKGNDF